MTALGAELGSHKRLAAQGDEFVRLRRGQAPPLPGVSKGLADLMASMMHPTPSNRPTAEVLA
jgi:hypothetical protein